MKKVFVIILATMFSLGVISQDRKIKKDDDSKMKSGRYCAELRDTNNIVILYNGILILEDVNLANGSTIKTNGIVVKKDGSKIELKNGECVDSLGNLIQAEVRLNDDNYINILGAVDSE